MTQGAPAQQGTTYHVDIVFCIDTTASMQPVLDLVKRNAMSFYDDLKRELDAKSKYVDQLRVKIIEFRDFYADGPKAMRESVFYSLPAQRGDFDAFVSVLAPEGGGDIPESGLEALSCAMQSAWSTGGDKRRHVIVVYTDAPAHALDCGKPKPPTYPAGMPKSLDDLTDMWMGGVMDDNAKRLLLFAPDEPTWSSGPGTWEQSIHAPSAAGEGLADVDYRTILDTIASSI